MKYLDDDEIDNIIRGIDEILRPILAERLGSKDAVGEIYVEFLFDDEIIKICAEVDLNVGVKRISDSFFTLPSTIGDKIQKVVREWFPIYRPIFCDDMAVG